MSAQALEFPIYLQLPVNAGALSPHQAWQLDWELEVLQGQPWTPGVFEINLLVQMFHLPVESMTLH